MRARLREVNDRIINEARALLDSLGDGLQLEGGQYYYFLTLSKAFRDLDDLPLPEVHGGGHAANADGPDTQHIAAAMARPVQDSVRRRALNMLRIDAHRGGAGLCDWQLENRLSEDHQTLSSARNWLVEQGWVRDSLHRRVNPKSGRPTIVWSLTPAALGQFAAAQNFSTPQQKADT